MLLQLCLAFYMRDSERGGGGERGDTKVGGWGGMGLREGKDKCSAE